MDNQPAPETMRHCLNCTFAVRHAPVAPSIIGETKCQLMPPQLVLVPTGHGASLVTMFPTVTADLRCAQHVFPAETGNEPEKKLIS